MLGGGAMPRVGWRKPESSERLSDHISIGVLTRTYPPSTVDAIIMETGKREQRHRLLPARVMVYYVMAMSLFSQDAYEEVMRRLVRWALLADGMEDTLGCADQSRDLQRPGTVGSRAFAGTVSVCGPPARNT